MVLFQKRVYPCDDKKRKKRQRIGFNFFILLNKAFHLIPKYKDSKYITDIILTLFSF